MRLLSIIILLCYALNLNAYPIEPRYLRNLVTYAETIVYGKVIAIHKVQGKNGGYQIAKLQTQEILKGKINQKLIEIKFYPHIICPTPARYKTGKTYLAFLKREQASEQLYTYGLSYGVKEIDQQAYKVYKESITAYQKILAFKDEPNFKELTINWLVACAAQKPTRKEGVSELLPGSYFHNSLHGGTYSKKEIIGTGAKKILRDALLSTNDLDPDDVSLLSLIKPNNDQELLYFLIKQSKEVAKGSKIPIYWNAVFRAIADLSNSEELNKLIVALNELKPWIQADRNKTIKLQQAFMDELL